MLLKLLCAKDSNRTNGYKLKGELSKNEVFQEETKISFIRY